MSFVPDFTVYLPDGSSPYAITPTPSVRWLDPPLPPNGNGTPRYSKYKVVVWEFAMPVPKAVLQAILARRQVDGSIRFRTWKSDGANDAMVNCLGKIDRTIATGVNRNQRYPSITFTMVEEL